MRQGSSDPAHDFGRMDSERQIRDGRQSRWLNDVAAFAEEECDGLIDEIERKAEMNEKDESFLASLEAAIGQEDVVESSDRKRQAQTLLTNADTLLAVYCSANEKIATTFATQNSPETLTESREADVEQLKNVMQAGKRICAGDLEAVVQQAKAKELLGKREVFQQAAGIFGTPRKGCGEGEGVDRTLRYVERGVRRMVKGLE